MISSCIHEISTPNQIWQADHTQLDILINGANGKPDRPWLTTVMDDYSRALCGYTVFTGAPLALNTALALRQAIWRKSDPSWAMCGLPDILRVDHGSDFTSHHLERTASCIDEHLHKLDAAPRSINRVTELVELLIIDEAERLNATALELLRDNHDRTHMPMILIGMPGIDQRFRHYPQRGNFRLLERLFPQITRVLKINQLETITDDVVEAAASILVVGN